MGVPGYNVKKFIKPFNGLFGDVNRTVSLFVGLKKIDKM